MALIKNIRNLLQSEDFILEFPKLTFRYAEIVTDLLNRNLLQIDFSFTEQTKVNLLEIVNNITSFIGIFGYKIILESATINRTNRLYLRYLSFSELMVYSDSMIRMPKRKRQAVTFEKPSSSSSQDEESVVSTVPSEQNAPQIQQREYCSNEKVLELSAKGVKPITFVRPEKMDVAMTSSDGVSRPSNAVEVLKPTAASLIERAKTGQFPEKVELIPSVEIASDKEIKLNKKIAELETKVTLGTSTFVRQTDELENKTKEIEHLKTLIGKRINTIADVTHQWVNDERKRIKRENLQDFGIRELNRFRNYASQNRYTTAQMAAGIRLRLLNGHVKSNVVNDIVSIFDRTVYTENEMDNFDQMSKIIKLCIEFTGIKVY